MQPFWEIAPQLIPSDPEIPFLVCLRGPPPQVHERMWIWMLSGVVSGRWKAHMVYIIQHSRTLKLMFICIVCVCVCVISHYEWVLKTWCWVGKSDKKNKNITQYHFFKTKYTGNNHTYYIYIYIYFKTTSIIKSYIKHIRLDSCE